MTDGIVEVEGRWDDAGVLWYACPYCADVHVSREPGLDEPPCTLLLLVLNRQTSRGCVLVRRTLPIGPLELGEWLGEVEQEVANLQTLCHACNAGKMASLPTPHDFGGAHA